MYTDLTISIDIYVQDGIVVAAITIDVL